MMKELHFSWQSLVAILAWLAALFTLPLSDVATSEATTAVLVVLAAAIGVSLLKPGPASHWGIFILAHIGALLLLDTVVGGEGTAHASFWLLLVCAWLLSWRLVTLLSERRSRYLKPGLGARIVVPALFGIWLLLLWEAIVRGAGIPQVLLPAPSVIGLRIVSSVPILWADFRQTVLKAVLFGYIAGSAAGFAVAILADRFRFLSNGLLPLGNMVSALPIIGIAPIMVMWFGFDWQSKAAVVVVMTFFPMLVNTIEGLRSAGRIERDLMHTYRASHWQTLAKLRLPAALPFIFNALKINSTLALIGALVAEFFGTPVVGMGFRISTEVGRMNLDMVWAEIALAAAVGSLFYGAIALLERAMTFWHPSYR